MSNGMEFITAIILLASNSISCYAGSVGANQHIKGQQNYERTTVTALSEEQGTTVTAALCMIIIIGMTVGCMCFWFCPVATAAQRAECCGARAPHETYPEDGTEEFSVNNRGPLKKKHSTIEI